MNSFIVKRNRLILFCLLLIVEPTIAMPSQELCTQNYHPYAMSCLAFFCLGTLLCTFIHKLCSHQHLISVIQKIDSEKELLQELQKEMLAIKRQEEQTLAIATEQKKMLQELTTDHNLLKLSLCILVTQASFAAVKENNRPLLKKIMEFNHIAYGNTILPVACYWKNKYLQEQKVFEAYKQQQITQQTPLLITANDIIQKK